jgi:hypothetical protein
MQAAPGFVYTRSELTSRMKTPFRWLAPLALLGGFSPAFAQSSQQVTVNAVVPVMMNVTVDNSNVVLTFAPGDYQSTGLAEKQVVNATTLKVSSNSRWRLYVSANSQNFSFNPSSGGQDPGKNCGDLSLSPNDTNSYFSMTTGNKDIGNGMPGGFDDAGHSIPVSYKLRTTLAGDPPGTYTLTITFSLMPG